MQGRCTVVPCSTYPSLPPFPPFSPPHTQSHNYYKDRHNLLSIDNVEPLPFFAMTAYPYNTTLEGYPTGEPYDSYHSTYNTRMQ